MPFKRFAVIAALALVSACAPPAAEQDAAAPALDLATVTSVEANARVANPLHVNGVAPANWYFENQFPVRLVGDDGAEIAMAPAHPRINWTEPGDKAFDVTLEFDVDADTPATLVLEEDMPGEGETPRAVRLRVVLAPS